MTSHVCVKDTATDTKRILIAIFCFLGDGTNTVTWEEFINNTTIHGVRYIFTKGLMIRR